MSSAYVRYLQLYTLLLLLGGDIERFMTPRQMVDSLKFWQVILLGLPVYRYVRSTYLASESGLPSVSKVRKRAAQNVRKIRPKAIF